MKCAERPFIKADELGDLREIVLTGARSKVKTPPQDKKSEVFVAFESRNMVKAFGWLTRNEMLDSFTNELFQDNRRNQNIHFIEWEDRFNCVVGDGICISQTNFYMEKPELEKLLSRMVKVEDQK